MPADFSSSLPDPAAFPVRHYRTVLVYGEEGFALIRKANVTIIGLGGVGGHAAVNLARSGIGNLHVVDFDPVSESSLNRSPFAEPCDIGQQKTAALRNYINRICPDTEVTTADAFASEDTLPQLVPSAPDERPDLVIDAIDSLNPKVSLLVYCVDHGIPVFASLGAAGKSDVGKVRTGDLSESTICPLARKLRSRLHRRGINGGISAVWSIEKSLAHRPGAPREVAPKNESEDTAPSYTTSRERHTLASQMTLPGVFGYGLAAMALDFISQRKAS